MPVKYAPGNPVEISDSCGGWFLGAFAGHNRAGGLVVVRADTLDFCDAERRHVRQAKLSNDENHQGYALAVKLLATATGRRRTRFMGVQRSADAGLWTATAYVHFKGKGKMTVVVGHHKSQAIAAWLADEGMRQLWGATGSNLKQLEDLNFRPAVFAEVLEHLGMSQQDVPQVMVPAEYTEEVSQGYRQQNEEQQQQHPLPAWQQSEAQRHRGEVVDDWDHLLPYEVAFLQENLRGSRTGNFLQDSWAHGLEDDEGEVYSHPESMQHGGDGEDDAGPTGGYFDAAAAAQFGAHIGAMVMESVMATWGEGYNG